MEKLKFVINENGIDEVLNREDYNILLELYRQIFMKIYGPDLFDSFLNVTKSSSKDIRKRKKVSEFSTNFNLAEKALLEIKENENIKLLCVYDVHDKFIGGGRLREINEKEASVPDLAIAGNDRKIWEQCIQFIEKYFTELGKEKLYLEIPSGDPALLYHAGNLGYQQVVESQNYYTYLAEKELERIKNAKFGNCS